MAALSGWVCVVTGASRGIGKGIALQLGEAGATVYITGRNCGTLGETAKEVEARGGVCVPVTCDSSKEDEIRSLFERIRREQRGRLDILVNNAYAGVQTIFENMGKKFWEVPPSTWDDINDVGLRGHYICSVYAARMMVPAGRGLIVIISSMGGLRYLFNVPYGVGKAACDRLASDGAVELRGTGVAMVSLWPGAVRTETIAEKVLNSDLGSKSEEEVRKMFVDGETPELSGKCIVGLAGVGWGRGEGREMKGKRETPLFSPFSHSPPSLSLSSLPPLSPLPLAGRKVLDYTSLSFLVSRVPGLAWLSPFIPSFLRVPKFVLTLTASKF
ncbi:dehydrogenase/reductase SDR family member 1-like [Polyodon spathula]|uniref:dehydrogenase/reductase SDR family member 1-like n=1 Tax=Polyodon spathula TaxID=7913 RepID=UPI001B7DC6D0|nr:dehydrogenase/reductase SDR family member 1-like [Polyodon spathula]